MDLTENKTAMVFEQYRLIIAAQPCRRGYGWADAHAELRAALP